jgi:uncharacterized protein (TIGR03067 family)
MRMRTSFLAALSAAAIVAGHAAGARADEPVPAGDLGKLQGDWTAMFGPEKNIPLVITIKGNAATFAITTPDGQERASKGEIKIDENAKPHKTIDWVKFRGRNGEEAPANLGIYTIGTESITVCNGGPGNERPTKFEAGSGGPPQLLVLNRKGAAGAADTLSGDLAKLQGRWTGKGGREKNATITITVKGNAVAFAMTLPDGQERASKGEIKIDENAKPHKTLDWVNFTNASGESTPTNLAIYRLKGDTLTLCSGGAGKERPTEFKAGEGNRPSLIELKRE